MPILSPVTNNVLLMKQQKRKNLFHQRMCLTQRSIRGLVAHKSATDLDTVPGIYHNEQALESPIILLQKDFLCFLELGIRVTVYNISALLSNTWFFFTRDA